MKIKFSFKVNFDTSIETSSEKGNIVNRKKSFIRRFVIWIVKELLSLHIVDAVNNVIKDIFDIIK